MEEEIIYHDNFNQYSNSNSSSSSQSYDQQLYPNQEFENKEIVFNIQNIQPHSSQTSADEYNSNSSSLEQEDEGTQQSSLITRQHSNSPSQNNAEMTTVALANANSNYNNTQQKQRLIVVNIPLQRYLFQNREYLLNGDILMNFNHEEFQRIGSFNKYKKMAKLQIDKNIDQLNIHMTNFQRGVDQFGDLIKFCSQQPNQIMHFIAEQLVRHQERVDKLRIFTTQIQRLPTYQQFLEVSEVVYQNFKLKCQQKLLEMIRTYTIKFYKTKYVKINYAEGTYEIEQMSMSQVLLAILGMSLEQAQQFIMRKGMFEFVFSLEEFGIELHCLNLYNQQITTYTSDSMIKTFDGIDLEVRTNFHIFYNTDNTIAQKGGIALTEFFIVVDYDITPNMLRKVMEIRKKEPNLQHIADFENESDWDYAASSKQFIQQFYPHKM